MFYLTFLLLCGDILGFSWWAWSCWPSWSYRSSRTPWTSRTSRPCWRKRRTGEYHGSQILSCWQIWCVVLNKYNRERKDLKAQLEEMAFRDLWVCQDPEDLPDHPEKMETRWVPFTPVLRNETSQVKSEPEILPSFQTHCGESVWWCSHQPTNLKKAKRPHRSFVSRFAGSRARWRNSLAVTGGAKVTL